MSEWEGRDEELKVAFSLECDRTRATAAPSSASPGSAANLVVAKSYAAHASALHALNTHRGPRQVLQLFV